MTTQTNGITITEIRIRLNPRDRDGSCPVAGWAAFVANDALYLNNITIRRHSSGRFTLEYPAHETGVSRFTIFKPISKEVGDMIERVVMDAFQVEKARSAQ
jgi:DNA-binding cell septation regulator SpoVG